MSRTYLEDPYGVPTGYVPRIEMIEPPPRHDDAIQKAVDDYRLMERKARAWDELYARAHDDLSLLALMERIVHPAQEPSKS